MSFRISQPSFQSLLVEIQVNGMLLSTATGVVVSTSSAKPFLITNRHVVTGRHQETDQLLSSTGAVPDLLRVSHNVVGALGSFEWVDVPLYDDGLPRWIEHPTLGAKADIVALPICASTTIVLYPYRAGYETDFSIEPSDRVSVVGFPFGEKTGQSFAVWATGFVASEPEIDHGGRPVFLVDCRARQGQSGSPVIFYRNGGGKFEHENGVQVVAPVLTFLGVYSGRINAESDLGTVWKSYAIAELVDHASILTGAD